MEIHHAHRISHLTHPFGVWERMFCVYAMNSIRICSYKQVYFTMSIRLLCLLSEWVYLALKGICCGWVVWVRIGNIVVVSAKTNVSNLKRKQQLGLLFSSFFLRNFAVIMRLVNAPKTNKKQMAFTFVCDIRWTVHMLICMLACVFAKGFHLSFVVLFLSFSLYLSCLHL